MKKSLLVIGILALVCSAASAQTFSLGFESYDKSIQYCDYETITQFLPFAAGTHVLTTGCGYPYDGAMVGLKGPIPASTGLPVTGASLILADNVVDAIVLGFSGVQLDWVTKTKASQKKFGWEFFETFGGGTDYLGNYGYLTTHLGPASHGLGPVKSSFSSAKSLAKKR